MVFHKTGRALELSPLTNDNAIVFPAIQPLFANLANSKAVLEGLKPVGRASLDAAAAPSWHPEGESNHV